jgi:hypothetical protein
MRPVAASVQQLEEHIFLVDFPEAEDVTVASSVPIAATIIAASKGRPMVLLAETPPTLRLVDPAMISYWLDRINRGEVNAKAIGVVSRGVVVRIALKALQSALKVYGKHTLISTHATREATIEWARSIDLSQL